MTANYNLKNWLYRPFAPISLAALNAKASMLERFDNKYIVRQSVLHHALPKLAEHFDILEINGQRSFTYETCCFDNADYRSYFDHHQERRRRFKVRLRKYTDAQLCFVEVKLKGKRGITVKKRLDHAVEKYRVLDTLAYRHIDQSYQELYGEAFHYTLRLTIEMCYQRITLVAKQGGERATIDSNLQFSAGHRSIAVDPDAFIVETKSAKGNGIADKVFRSLHQHPTKRCSKYCIAMASLRVVDRHNKFLPALRKLNLVPNRSELLSWSISG